MVKPVNIYAVPTSGGGTVSSSSAFCPLTVHSQCGQRPSNKAANGVHVSMLRAPKYQAGLPSCATTVPSDCTTQGKRLHSARCATDMRSSGPGSANRLPLYETSGTVSSLTSLNGMPRV